MAEKTYHRIAAVQKTARILKVIGDSKVPITGSDIAIQVNEPAGTVMCHLATLEDFGLVQEVGGGWLPGLALALYWAKRKATLETHMEKINTELDLMGRE